MSPNRRIFLNIIATYGRSLYALVLGLMTARWALSALGEVDYGLMGLVGGLTGFITLINTLLSTAVGRFYAVYIGKASIMENKNEGILECNKWFSSAVIIHTIVPFLLLVIGYPIGVWAIRNFFTIPTNRVMDCIWVFRFVCITCFLAMISVPVSAMYRAKQCIAELTVYSFVTTTLNAIFLYYMSVTPGVWLAKYAFWTCLLAIVPQIIITTRGFVIFPECRFKFEYCLSASRAKSLFSFAGWSFFGLFGGILRNQGMQILVNKYFGPRMNTSMSIANSVNAQTTTLSGAMLTAFQPAIVSAYGAGDNDKMRTLAFRACKFAMLLMLIFALPISLELRQILRLWLKSPPMYTYGLCLIMFAMTIIDQSTIGYIAAVNANGRIAKYQTFLGSSLMMALPIAWFLCALGLNVYFCGLAMLITLTICAWGRVWFGRQLVGLSVRYWAVHVVLPVFILGIICALLGILPRFIIGDSLLRIVFTTFLCELVLMLGAWLGVLDDVERAIVRRWANRFKEKVLSAYGGIISNKTR